MFSYSSKKWDPNIFVFIFAKKCQPKYICICICQIFWPKYICIHIWAWKLYLSHTGGIYSVNCLGIQCWLLLQSVTQSDQYISYCCPIMPLGPNYKLQLFTFKWFPASWWTQVFFCPCSRNYIKEGFFTTAQVASKP